MLRLEPQLLGGKSAIGVRLNLQNRVHHNCAISPITIFRMNTYKNKGLKVPLESTLTEKGVGGTPNRRSYGERG